MTVYTKFLTPPGDDALNIDASPHTNTESSPEITPEITPEIPPTISLPLPLQDGGSELVFPHLNPSEHKSIADLIGNFPPDIAQKILDELAGNIKNHSIRSSPISLCRGLIKSANEGRFFPELGCVVADARKHAKKHTMEDKPVINFDPKAQEIGEKFLQKIKNRSRS